jgi:uncharacterized protein
MSPAMCIAKVIRLNGGRIVGKTRLQKTVYFLEQLGVGFGFDFEYHYYGPYSEELTAALDDSIALKIVDETIVGGNYEQPYSTFTTEQFPSDEDIDEDRMSILDVLRNYNAIVLELAATADFIKNYSPGREPWKETSMRKSDKATPERIQKAQKLLSDLGIA